MSMYKTPVISVNLHLSTQRKLIILAVSHRFVNLVLTFVFYMFYFEVTIFLHMCNILFSATFSSFVFSTFIQFCFLFFFFFVRFYETLLICFPPPQFFAGRWRDSIDSNQCCHDQKYRFYHAKGNTT